MRRIHLLALPHTQTTAKYALDGFSQATIRFARILQTLGAHVTLYASDENEAPCDELVPVITKEEQTILLAGGAYQYAAFENKYPLWQLANARMITEIGKRKQPRDLICTIGGTAQQPVADAHPDLMTVEYSIGYIGSFAKYRVYQSHVWRHWTQGSQQEQQGRFFDTVIPYFFDPADYPVKDSHAPYLVYVGRLTPNKGIGIACQAAAAAGVPLKVIGHGDPSLVTHGAEYLGALETAAKNQWVASARAILAPTLYLEPFGAAVVEAALSGVPAITTDFGAFVETVDRGVTGYQCTYLGEFVEAIRELELLDRAAIRARAKRLYSLGAVTPQYQHYFDRLDLLWDQGWNTGA